MSTFSVESIVAVITSWHGAGLLAKLRALAYVPNDACKPLQKFACAPLREADGPGTKQGAAYFHALHTDAGMAHAWRAGGLAVFKKQIAEYSGIMWPQESA